MPAAARRSRKPARRMPKKTHRTPAAARQSRKPARRMPEKTHRTPAAAHRMPATAHRMPAAAGRLPALTHQIQKEMKLRNVMIVALAVAVCAGTNARSRKKRSAAPAAVSVQPVPADSFSYAEGMVQGASLKGYLPRQFGVDTAYVADVARGITDSLSEEETKKLMAYVAGLQIAQMNRNYMKSLNMMATGKADTTYADVAAFGRGVAAALLGQTEVLTPDSASRIVERQQRYMAETTRLAGEQFLLANKKAAGVKTTASGLQYRVLTQGTGAVARDTSDVEVHYEGRLLDGTVFDSSYQRGKPATFKPTQVIKGWTEALQLMPEGSTWEVYVPWALAYGERGSQPKIPPYATLIFKIEVLKVK